MKDEDVRHEATRILNFLASYTRGVSSAESPVVRRIMLDTSGEMLAQGHMWNIVAKPLGAGVYQLRLTPSPRENAARGRKGAGAGAVALLLLCLALPAGAQTLFGVVTRVSDGDTLVVGKTRIRLYGIDAPEGRQECRDTRGQAYRCGDSATFYLSRLAPVGPSISCRVRDVDRYGRLVAVCSVAQRSGSDLGREMVAAGRTVAYRRYSTRYVADELLARQARRGIWAGTFVSPEEWRRGGGR